MNQLLQTLLQEAITKGLSEKVGTSLGISEEKASSVISFLAPAVIGGLQKNAEDPQEAQDIVNALEKDHSNSSLFDHLDDLISQPATAKGDGILKHVLGENRMTIEEKVAKQSGVDSTIVSQIFTMIAPLVMGYLGKNLLSEKNNSNTSGLTDMLTGILSGGQTQKKEQSFLTSLLDQDNDGNIADDILSMGMKFLQKKA